ncbi:MAG: HAMP domain-containing protein [Betaproteobacteria bacterium]|nr:HAMP domain-containing protein [Betaproteobacteria bacterium]
MSALPGKRGLRWLLLAAASLSAIALFLLATATANTSLFAQGYDQLVVLNGVLIVLLMLVVGWQLWQLRRNLKAGIFGSRLAVRLVLLFALVAVLPGALVYAVSVQSIGRSIESWFDVRVDRALEGGLNLGRNALDYLLKETASKASQMALTLADSPGNLASALNRAAEQGNVYEAVLFSPTGSVLAVAGVGGSRATPEPPPAAALRAARLQQPYTKIEQTADGGLVLRAVVPVNTQDNLNPLKLLQVTEPVPKSLAQDAERVQAGVRDYQELSFSRMALKRLYALTLTLTLLLALTSALGLAVVLSERFAAPLGLLAEGTRAVAQGDFTRRQPVVSRDELGVLTESFNTMTAQLAEAQGRAEESRRAIETTRAYLESILGNLSAGVLVFDERHRLRTVNPSAAVILQQPLAELTGMALADWGRRLPALAPFAELVSEGFRGGRDGQWQREADVSVANLSRTLLMRGTRLPGTTTSGYVVVFDDVSELVQAQRDAAWAEVARRLAHEIKNPLTPIQLSAERLAMKLEPKVDGADRETLLRGTRTIVSQVAAMKHMVDDFAIYARQPRPGQLQTVDFSALLLDVLALYDNLVPHVALSLPDAPVHIQGEPTRLRQVFHNLLSNAVDAQADVPDPRYAIALTVAGGEATLSVADHGPGFPEQVLAHPFEPYVTTKTKGTGLGLAIVKKIIEEHGGRVVLANVPGGGGCVTLVLPYQPAAARPAAAAA